MSWEDRYDEAVANGEISPPNSCVSCGDYDEVNSYCKSDGGCGWHSTLVRFYELYKLDWVTCRGYNIEDHCEEHGFNGESWVCYEEFLNSELQDSSFMRYLLSDIDFELWHMYRKKS